MAIFNSYVSLPEGKTSQTSRQLPSQNIGRFQTPPVPDLPATLGDQPGSPLQLKAMAYRNQGLITMVPIENEKFGPYSIFRQSQNKIVVYI